MFEKREINFIFCEKINLFFVYFKEKMFFLDNLILMIDSFRIRKKEKKENEI